MPSKHFSNILPSHSTVFSVKTGIFKSLLLTLTVLFATSPATSFAQIIGTEPPSGREEIPESLPEIPPEVAGIRTAQAALARSAGVELGKLDVGKRSSSGVDGVPQEFRSRAIRNPAEARALSRALYRYYGLQATESLELEHVLPGIGQTNYQFRQFIDGIETSNLLNVWVDDQTFRVNRFIGHLDIDRGLDRIPELNERDAIQASIDLIERNVEFDADNYLLSGAHFGEVVYRRWGDDAVFTPMWRIFVQSMQQNSTGEQVTYHAFIVDPRGTARVDGVVEMSVRICDGTGSTASDLPTVRCKYVGDLPIVVDVLGNCSATTNCDAYQTARSNVNAVEAMWEDLLSSTGCCNVGIPNTANDGTIDVNIGGDVPDGDAAYAVQGPSATIIIESILDVGDKNLIGHEMGHAAHHYKGNGTYLFGDRNSISAPQRENRAVKEFIAETMGVIFNNYRGPRHDPKIRVGC